MRERKGVRFMLKIYKTDATDKKIKKIKKITLDCWIDLTSPTNDEIEKVVSKTQVDKELILKLLDTEELPRIEQSGNATLVVIDTPYLENQYEYTTYPLGIIITENNYVITISTKKVSILDDFKQDKVKNFRTAKKTRFLIQIILRTASSYLRVLKKVNDGTETFYNRYSLFELKFPIDEDGNCIYESKKQQHIINGIPQFDYMTLPKLSIGTNMFHSCILDKPSTLSVLNSLPTYTSGTHNFCIGIDTHLQYDPEINLALKKVDINYEPTCSLPIDEETGEETVVTSGKGWNLTVEWNGPYNSNLDELKQKLQFDTIVLPPNYTRLEYLQTRRFNYIDTEYTPSNTTGLYLMAKIPFYWAANYTCIFGSGQLATNNCLLSPLWARNTVQPSRLGYWKSTGYNLSGKGDGRIYEGWLNYNNSREARLTVGDEEYNQQNLPEITASTKNIIMFGYRSGAGNISAAPSRIYRAQITEGAELVRDFIPCLNPEGEPCMYDIIQGKEYNNAVPEKNEDFIYKVATN
jgi:hypothetical protein